MACGLCCPSCFPHAVRVQGLPGWKSPGSVGAGLQRVACVLCCLCFAWWRCRWCPAARSVLPCSVCPVAVRCWSCLLACCAVACALQFGRCVCWCLVVYLVKCPPERLSPACRACPSWRECFAVRASPGGPVAGRWCPAVYAPCLCGAGRCLALSGVHLRACHQLAGPAPHGVCALPSVLRLVALSLVSCRSVGPALQRVPRACVVLVLSGGLVRCRWCLAARSVRVWWCVVVYLVKCPPERLSPACRACPPWPVRFAVCASPGGLVAGAPQCVPRACVVLVGAVPCQGST